MFRFSRSMHDMEHLSVLRDSAADVNSLIHEMLSIEAGY